MNESTAAALVTAFAALGGGDEAKAHRHTSFAELSQEAQDAIVWAVTSGEGEKPPPLSDAVKEEIRRWAMEADPQEHAHHHENHPNHAGAAR